jgi:DNA mismatch endonuclease (patch repair protein)
MDRHTKEQRARNMSRIRKFGNESTEMRLVRLFREHRITGWRRHLRLPGRPDFTFRRARVVVFIDGCFWHRCPECNWKPTSNTEYWLPKLKRNVAKDREADRELAERGWAVLRVWEHLLKTSPEEVICCIEEALARGRSSSECAAGRFRKSSR